MARQEGIPATCSAEDQQLIGEKVTVHRGHVVCTDPSVVAGRDAPR